MLQLLFNQACGLNIYWDGA